MSEARIGDAALLECAACGAMWVDAGTFEHICADREAQSAALHLTAAPRTAAATAVKYRPCVACGKMMNRLNFARLSGTVVDVCKGHGTLLDAGELHAIVTFIRQGGLDRARQRQLEDVKEEVERLRALQSRTESSDVRFEMSARSWSAADFTTLLNSLRRHAK